MLVILSHSGAKTIEIDCQKNGGTGLITAELVDAHGVWTRDVHLAQTKLIVLENTIDGHVMPLKNIKRIIDLAAQRDCLVHMDGARIWHAAVATNVPVLEMCTGLNSVSLCFSKGLGAPVGSVLAGSSELIDKARYLRKIWGGGWRQAGGLAAACIYALDNNIDRLKIDHKVAKELSDELRHRGYKVEQSETNMVWVENNDPDIEAKMDKRGVNVFGGAKMRIVVHFQNHAGVSALLDGFPMIKDS